MACFANAAGGTLFIGVDRDGTVSGCFPFHGDATDPDLLATAVYRHTSPGLPVHVDVARIDGKEVVAVTCEAHPSPVATTWGTYRTRRISTRGVAECVGMDPAFLFTRYRDAHGMDWALVPAAGATLDSLDPMAIAAYRDACTNDRIRSLDDASLLRSLGFLNDSVEPVTLGAIALFGTPDALRKYLPFHQVVVSDRRQAPRTWRSSAPLALMLADLKRNEATFSQAFPLVINALLHRDYFLPAPVYVALDEDGARVSSPGAAPRGVDLAAVAAGARVYAPRSLYLSTAVSHTSITEGAGAGIRGVAASAGAPISFAGSHDQGVVASLTWVDEARGGQTGAVAATLSPNEAKALAALRTLSSHGEGAASSEVATAAKLSTQQAYRALRKLVSAGLATKTGETRTTRYFAIAGRGA